MKTKNDALRRYAARPMKEERAPAAISVFALLIQVFFKPGQSLTPIQRAGFTLLCVGMIVSGFFLAAACLGAVQAKNLICVFLGAASLLFLSLGAFGLKNTLRTRLSKR